jgi:hypothetical protein
MDPKDSWNEWSKYVLKELERLNDCYDRISKDVGDVKMELAMNRGRSSVWGAIAGLVGGILMSLVARRLGL